MSLPTRKRKPTIVRAIHPSAAVRAWYQRTLDRYILAMHDQVTAHVLAVYSQAEPVEIAHDAAKLYQSWDGRTVAIGTDAVSRNPSILIRNALRRWGGAWVRRFDKMSTEIADKFTKKSFANTQDQMRAAFAEAGFTVRFAPTPGSVAAYHAVAAEQVNLIRSIPQQYLKDVESKVWQSVMKGGDMHTLSANLKETYGVTTRRAALIARDQNAKAKAIIEQTRRKELGVVHAIWMHSAGGKVPRATHVAMDAKPYEIAVGMWDSDEGEYVLPGQLINCRCTSKAVIPAFDDVLSATATAVASRPTELLAQAAARARTRRKDPYQTPY